MDLILTKLDLINQRLEVLDRRIQVIEKIARESQEWNYERSNILLQE